jgi:diguanylate cyclase (GGDEF)-like protein
MDLLKRRAAESHRFGIPLSVLHLKIEDYDVLKEKYGFAIARQMVDTAAPALEKTLGESEVLARLEHGEFSVMLPGKTQNEAALVGKKMRVAAANCVLPMLDRELQLRFAEGVAELKANETAHEVLARARQVTTPATPSRQPVEV